jgi:hypothetical protein
MFVALTLWSCIIRREIIIIYFWYFKLCLLKCGVSVRVFIPHFFITIRLMHRQERNRDRIRALFDPRAHHFNCYLAS